MDKPETQNHHPFRVKDRLKPSMFKLAIKTLRAKEVNYGHGCNKKGRKLAFGIVHWNCFDFLKINLNRIKKIHPEARLYVFDNHSNTEIIPEIDTFLKDQGYDDVTVFLSSSDHAGWACHMVGLQYIFEKAIKNDDKLLVYLDQDCILERSIETIISEFYNNHYQVFGARDYVQILKDYEYVKKGYLRNFPDATHASFMGFSPHKMFLSYGRWCMFTNRAFEPYHGLSQLVGSKNTLFLETRMHEEIPLLTNYSLCDISYAWHAWYSSRLLRLKGSKVIDGMPAWWLMINRARTLEFMEKLPYPR